MTRPYNQQFHCPNCRTWVTAETLFGRWIRNHPELDSRNGYSITDQDYWVHRFRTELGREFQCLMLVEIKVMAAELTDAQRDTLHFVNQVMRNRRSTPTKEIRCWDSRNISEEQLTGLLRFDLHPDTLCPMDWRSHHAGDDANFSLLLDATDDGR